MDLFCLSSKRSYFKIVTYQVPCADEHSASADMETEEATPFAATLAPQFRTKSHHLQSVKNHHNLDHFKIISSIAMGKSLLLIRISTTSVVCT